MIPQIATVLLLAITMTLSQSAYAADAGDTSADTTGPTTSNTPTSEPSKDNAPDSSSSPSQQDTPKSNQEETPQQEQQQEQGPSKTLTPTTDLPKCDGSKQDCVTANGDVCKAGTSTGHECECADDMHDCPNHPSIVNPIIPSMTVTASPDGDCLFHPELPKCKSDNGKCPDGFAQNEDGNCFPRHDKCPKGFHGHEDDETGRCISDKVPCDSGYIRDPNFPTCSKKESVCREHPQIKECGGKGNDDHGDRHVVVIHKTKVIHKTDLGHVSAVFVKGIGLVEPFNCVLNTDKARIGCEFVVVKVIN